MSLAETLMSAWTKDVSSDYGKGLINSHGCLQAALYHSLRLRTSAQKIFVKPTLCLSGQDSEETRPDVVICEGERVAAVVELRFAPHRHPAYRLDIEKINRLGMRKDERHHIEIDPRTGNRAQRTYLIDEKMLLMYGVIAQHNSSALSMDKLSEHLNRELSGRFYLLFGRVGARGTYEYGFAAYR